jgi:hypothetical protein
MYSVGVEIEMICINVSKPFRHYLALYEFQLSRDKSKDGIKIELIGYKYS